MNAIAYAYENTLHDDIVERRRQMRLTLASLRSDARTATCVRARAIDESLATLQTHLSAGWDANNRRRGGRAHVLARPLALSLRRPVADIRRYRLDVRQESTSCRRGDDSDNLCNVMSIN